MTRAIVSWSLNFRLLALPVAALLLVVGVTQLRDMPVSVLPEFTAPYVEIQTEALGLSGPEVEELITVPLERDLLNGVEGIDVIRSESVLGLSSVTLVFEPGTNLLDARQKVQERLLQSKLLPNVSKPPTMLQPLSSESRVLIIGLSAKKLSLVELGLLARWTIRPRLMGVSGVANVVMWGQREHELQVLVDPKRLHERGVSLQQVIKTAGNAQLVSPLSFLEASTPGSGGFIETPNQRLQVRHILPIANPSGLAQVPVDQAAGSPEPRVNGKRMRLGDVTDIVEDHQPLIGDAVVNGGPGLLLVVEKFPGASTIEVTRDVEEGLRALRPGLAGVEIDSSVFRPADYVESATDNLTIALLIGALLLALVLIAVLFRWRTVVFGLFSILLSVIVATLVLALRGETMNALVFAGLVVAIGVLVDDALLGAENVWRRLREDRGASPRSTGALVLDATLEMRRPLGYATVIVLLAVLPVFFLPGRAGAFFEPFALSYALAVLASAVVALTVTPALALMLLPRGGSENRGRESPFFTRVTPRYRAALSRVVGSPGLLFLAAGLVAVAGLALTPLFGQSLVPSFKERALLVHLDAAPGTSRPEMVRIAGRVGRELRAVPGVRNVGAQVGRAVMGDQVIGTDSGELWVSLDEDAAYDTTVRRIKDALGGYPGVDLQLVSYSGERIRAVGAVERGNFPGAPAKTDLGALLGRAEPVVVRVYGNEPSVIRRKAEEVRRAMDSVDGVVNVRVEPQILEPTLDVTPNIAAARRYGIKPGDIRRAAAILVEGIAVGALFEEQKVFDVVVMGVPEFRNSLTSVENLLIDRPDGGQVRLADVADVRMSSAPTVIRREGSSRRLDVVADLRDRSPGDVSDDVERSLKQISFPLEYHAEVLDDTEQAQAADLRLLALVLAAALAILLILQAAFRSLRLAFLFLVSLPVALAGGVLAAFLEGDRTLSLGAAAGLLAVFGIAVRNGVTLIDHYQRLERREGEVFGPNLVLRGTQERLAPILATALAVLFALGPFLVLGSVPGYEIVHPMAVVVLGGLVTATLYTLFVVPALYLHSGAGKALGDEEELLGDFTRRVHATGGNRSS